MTDRPIIFSGPMMGALMDGRKFQTRRVLKPQLGDIAQAFEFMPGKWRFVGHDGARVHQVFRPPYAPGDRLWVREAWKTAAAYDDLAPSEMGGEEPKLYDADQCWDANGWPPPSIWGRYRHARFMPRWASRMTLGVTEVRVQRLQEISEADARAEGCWHKFERTDEADDWYSFSDDLPWRADYPKAAFRDLWNSLHGPDAWDANPWVCAISFDVHRCNIDHMPGRDG